MQESSTIKQELLVATTNQYKLKEIRELLSAAPVQLVELNQFPNIKEPEETENTFSANARLKASSYSKMTKMLTVAEDSGLVIDALNGDPGVYSARFVSSDATYQERFVEIFRRLKSVPHLPRTARFICALAVVDNEKVVFETSSTIEGEITKAVSGSAGFGYDPIFYYPPYNATLAEVSQHDKLLVAHRGKAFRNLKRWLINTKNYQLEAQ